MRAAALDWTGLLEDDAVRSIRLVAILVLFPLLLLGASRAEDETPGWTKTGKTYHTTRELPAGTLVRIRVERHGKKAELMLVQWHGGKKKQRRFTELEAWPGRSMKRGQVLQFELPHAMRIGLRVGRKNGRDANGLVERYGYHRLRFGEGWRFDVRAIDPSF